MALRRPHLQQCFSVIACLAICGCGGSGGAPDPDASRQWHLRGDDSDPSIVSINLPKNCLYRGQGVLVSIVDNGLDLAHEDLADNITWGNFSYLPSEY